MGTSAFERLSRIPLDIRLACAQKGQPSTSYDIQVILGFAALPMSFHLQKHARELSELRSLDDMGSLNAKDPARSNGWDLDHGCYAARAWQVEQLFRMREGKPEGPEHDALSTAVKRSTLDLVSGILALHRCMERIKKDATEDYARKHNLIDPPNVTMQISPFDFADLNRKTLRLEGTADELRALYRTSLMPIGGFFDACCGVVALGCDAHRARREHDLTTAKMTALSQCFGLEGRSIAYYLDDSRRCCTRDQRLENMLRPVFVLPFAAIWESGAVLAKRDLPAARTRPQTELERRLSRVEDITPVKLVAA